jgi:hypothetical protein
LVKGLAIPLRLVVEEISEIECRKVQQEIELYNVTPAEEGKRESEKGKERKMENEKGRERKEVKLEKERTRKEEAGEKGTEGEKGNGRVANDGRPKQLLTRAISGRWKRHCCFVFNPVLGVPCCLEKRFRGKFFTGD